MQLVWVALRMVGAPLDGMCRAPLTSCAAMNDEFLASSRPFCSGSYSGSVDHNPGNACLQASEKGYEAARVASQLSSPEGPTPSGGKSHKATCLPHTLGTLGGHLDLDVIAQNLLQL